MILTLAQIAQETQSKYIGEKGNLQITAASKLEEGKSGSLGFFANPKYEHLIYETQCSAVFVPLEFEAKQPVNCELLYHTNPYFAFCMVLTNHFNPNIHNQEVENQAYVHPTAVCKASYIGHFSYIDERAKIGANCIIYPGCYIGKDAVIGEHTVLYPNVVIYSKCEIGSNVIIHAGTVIGSDGFGFAPVNGKYVKIPQIGNVIVEDWVEIGSNCSIDRATMGSTVIKMGTKLDNLVQIAHNVEVGEHTVIASQTGIAGSTKVGGYSQFGGQCGIGGHLVIAPHTSAGGQAGITGNITTPHQKLTGTPATDVREFLKSVAGSRKVPDLMREIEGLKKEIHRISEEISSNKA